MNIKEQERIDQAMKYGKRISNKVKKELIPIKSLPNAELRISNDDGWTISGHIKYNHHRINFTYYRWLPKYSKEDKFKLNHRVIIHDWWFVINQDKGFDRTLLDETLKTVGGELKGLFDNMVKSAA